MNSNINIIGSIADINMIYQVILNEDSNELDKLLKIRTAKSKERIVYAIKSAFGSDSNADQEILFKGLLMNENFIQLKMFALFMQFSFNNKLFFLLNKNVLIKNIRNGKVNLNRKDVIAYISSLKETEVELKGWSESTINIVATKYISFLKKIGFIKAGRKNELVYFMPSESMLILFIYMIKAVEKSANDLFRSNYIDLIFVEKNAFIELIKTISMKEFFNVRTNGEELFAELIFEYSEVVNALSKRYQTKI